MAQICTLEDLKNDPMTAIKLAKTTGEPVYVNVNGNAPAVLLDADLFLEKEQALNEFKRIFIGGVQGKPQGQ